MHILNKFSLFLEGWKPTLELVWSKDLLIIEQLERFVKYKEEVIQKILDDTLLLT